MTPPSVDPEHPSARVCLPVLGDLWGLGWREDIDEGFDPTAVHGGPDECLPDAFPDAARVDEADVTFVQDLRGGLVHAVATVFTTESAASTAWTMLGDAAFLDCFAGSVGGDVELTAPDELLGPVPIGDRDRGGPVPTEGSDSGGTHTEGSDAGASHADDQAVPATRTRHYRASFTGTDGFGVRPVALTIAVIGRGHRVVLVAGANRPSGQMERGWARLVANLETRVSGAGPSPPAIERT